MNSLIGQYECAHRSGLGLDYFTAKLDRLTIYANGRFALVTQDKSRLIHAAKSLASGQQASMDAPETRGEGSYSSQNDTVSLVFDDGQQEQGQILAEGLQFGKDFYEKVSESTFMPPTQRVKSNMEDIAKGLKIAGTIGGTMMKAARSIQDSIQTQPSQNQAGTPANQQNAGPAPAQQPAPSAQSWQAPPAASNVTPPPVAHTVPQFEHETYFCDQCGSPVRAGKRFCNKCGASVS
jgi:hypothetical protein